MATHTKNTNGLLVSLLLSWKLLFTIFRESFRHLNKTTYVTMIDKGKGKGSIELLVTYK